MKLRTPFNMIKNALSDIGKMHDFSYTVPNETRDEFWTKNVVTIQQHLNAKFMRANNNKLCTS